MSQTQSHSLCALIVAQWLMCCHSSTVLHSFIRSHVRVCLIARLTNLLTWFHLHQNLTNGLGTALRSWVELLRVRIRVSVLPSETASLAWWKSMMPQGASRSQFMPTLPTLLTSRSCNAHNPLLLNVRAPSLYRHIGWVFPPWEQPAARGPQFCRQQLHVRVREARPLSRIVLSG